MEWTKNTFQIFSRKRKIVLSSMALLSFIMTTIVMLLDTLPPVDLLPDALPLNTLLLIRSTAGRSAIDRSAVKCPAAGRSAAGSYATRHSTVRRPTAERSTADCPAAERPASDRSATEHSAANDSADEKKLPYDTRCNILIK